MKLNFIITIFIISIVQIPLVHGACSGTWPYCCSGCTANDVAITNVWLTSDSTCTPGTAATATLWAKFHVSSSSARHCAHTAIQVKNLDGSWRLIENHIGELPTSDFELQISQVSYICGQSLEVKDIYAAWNTDSGACAYDRCADYIPAKCYYSGSTINVPPPLIADFIFTKACLGTSTSFTDKTTGGVAPYGYAWTFGDGSSSTAKDPTHTYASAGTYSVKLIVTDSLLHSSQRIYDVIVYPLPDCTITSTSSVCAGSTGNTASVPNAGTGATYAWTITGGTITSQSPYTNSITWTAGSAGTASIIVTVNDAHCSKACSKEITINPLPDCTVNAASSVCAGSTSNTASVANAGAGATYVWTITGGAITSSPPYTNSITWTAGTAGTASIKVTVTTPAGCTVPQCSKEVTIDPLPDCTINADSSVCAGSTSNTASVANAGAGATYAWTITGGTITSQSPYTNSITWTAGSAGTASIKVAVTTPAGCTVPQCSKEVTINPLPDCTITSPSFVCAGSMGNTASVTNAGTGATYAWTITGGTITSSPPYTNSITWTAGSTGTAFIRVTVNDAHCSKACSNEIRINPLPDCTITSPSFVCAGSTGNTASVTNAGAGATYVWTIIGGAITSSPPYTNSITWTAGTAGTASIKVTVTTPAGCTVPQCSKEVTIDPLPDCTINADSSVCAGSTSNTASVANAGAGATYAWTITGGTITSSPPYTNSITWTAGSAGTASIKVTVTTTAGCTVPQCSKEVTINPLPDCTINADSSICAGSTSNTASVANAGAGATYAWTITGGTITSSPPYTNSITWTAGTAGTAFIKVTLTTPAGCTTPLCSKQVSILGSPIVSAGSDQDVCDNVEKVPLIGTNSGGAATYLWTSSGTEGTISNPTSLTTAYYIPSAADKVAGSVTITLTATGCSDQSVDQMQIVIWEIPPINVEALIG